MRANQTAMTDMERAMISAFVHRKSGSRIVTVYVKVAATPYAKAAVELNIDITLSHPTTKEMGCDHAGGQSAPVHQ